MVLVYTTQVYSNSKIVTLFSDEMGLARHFFSPGSRQEVNSTWYPEIAEPIKSHEKHYSLVLYILKRIILVKDIIILKFITSGDEEGLFLVCPWGGRAEV